MFKGFIIGLAKIIPGVSGSLVALNLGLYEKGINAISYFYKDIKKNAIFLINIGIGILIAIIFGSKVISFLLNKYYFLTMITFIGLLIGSDIAFLKNMKSKKDYIYSFITFILTFTLFFIKTDFNYTYNNTFLNNLFVIFLGFLDASTMIIPAISGTVLFMLFGTYDFILSLFSNMFSNIKITIYFFIGLMIGVILVTRLMSYLLRTKKSLIYSMINGFFLSSMLYLIIETFKISITFNELLLSIPLFIISYKVGKLNSN